jgi:iron-sulfur cluster assembly accessory protein
MGSPTTLTLSVKAISQIIILKVDELDFFIPSDSLDILEGCQVDYTIEGLNQGVKFLNPNASAVCGCGESFTVSNEKDQNTSS